MIIDLLEKSSEIFTSPYAVPETIQDKAILSPPVVIKNENERKNTLYTCIIRIIYL